MNLESKLITIAEAVRLIASRDHRKSDDKRTAMDRARKRIKYAIKKGDLRPDKSNKLELKHIACWANDIWPGKFTDIPSESYPYSINLPIVITVTASQSVPQTIEECQKEIRALRKEIALLKPLAEKWKNFCEGNRRKRKKLE
jgi:hypothetical protein